MNLAEVLYNEARGERRGAQSAVAWSVRDRALEALRGVWNGNGSFAGTSCDSYPGGFYSQSTCAGLPCNDVNQVNCNLSRWYCCAIHGGKTTLGGSQLQYNDEHVDWPTLAATGLPDLALWVENGNIPDTSSMWAPPGVYNCYIGCNSPYPWCNTGSNIADGSPNGAMEYRSGSYTAGVSFGLLSDCKQLAWDPEGRYRGFVCGGVNYFWNRLDHSAVGRLDSVTRTLASGCSADPDTPWQTNFVDIYVDGAPGTGSYLGRVPADKNYYGGCTINGQNYGYNRGFTFTLPSQYQTGTHSFYAYGSNTSPGAPSANLSQSPTTRW